MQYAICWNSFKKTKDTVKLGISRSKTNRKKMAVNNSINSKIGITEYEVIKEFNLSSKLKISLVKCKLLTGRTHQIRVHMSYIGNPLIGDILYSRKVNLNKISSELKNYIFENFIKIERHALHAYNIGFKHPKTLENKIFNAKLPIDFTKFIYLLEQNNLKMNIT